MSDENLATQVEEEVEVVETPSNEPEDIRDVVARELDKLEQAESKPETEESKPDNRDEKGRFKAKEESSSAKEESEAVSEQPQVEEKPVEEKPRNPFSSWKREAQEQLSKLDPTIQQYIIDREGQFHKGIEQYKADAQVGKVMKQVVEPFNDYFKQLGVEPTQAIPKILDYERRLRTSSQEAKTQMFMQMAHDYGVDVNALQQTPFNAQEYRLQQELAAMREQVAALGQHKQLSEEAQLGQTIQGFAQSHEYFEDVRETMADLLDRGLANDLEDAYAKSIRLNDDVFNRLQSQQTANNQMQQIQRADQAAKAAKASAVSVKGAPTGITRAPEPKSTEDAVRLAMAQLGL
jgi:hypothetical protein